MTRRAGVMIPLFSLRSASGWGLGEIPDLVPFARWASAAGFQLVQILPVNEPARGQHSPYAALTAFALDPAYLALECLDDFHAAGGHAIFTPQERAALDSARAAPAVAWDTIRRLKDKAIHASWRHFRANAPPAARAELEEYCAQHRGWLDTYTLWAAIHDAHRCESWTTWTDGLRHRDPGALATAAREHEGAVELRRYTQWQLDRQWRDARWRAGEAGVQLMGDLPFMVAGDSADVWARAGEFRMDATVGVPPDAFSADGQDWGLPVYRWDVMERADFEWMRLRAARAAELYAACRVDHVVGLYRTYFRPLDGAPRAFTPADESDQTRLGERLLGIFRGGLEVIAEDLGVIPDFVRASLSRLAIPGYKVMRWEQDEGPIFRNPAHYHACSVATTGTHDTETLAEWWDAAPAAEKKAFLALPGLEELAAGDEPWGPRARDAILAVLYGSASDLVIVPFVDALGTRDRINVPGTVADSNWVYRMPTELGALAADEETTRRLRGLARRGGREPAGS
jgi:4-alpha-glucanotransferase